MFFFFQKDAPYKSLGCYRDNIVNGKRVIPSIEGITPFVNGTIILDGHYKSRWNAIGKCYLAAWNLGYTTFAVQDGGQCFSSADARKNYNKFGKINACESDGKGGPMANEVYAIKGICIDISNKNIFLKSPGGVISR